MFLNKANELDSKNPIIKLHLAELYLHELKYKEAVEVLKYGLICLESSGGNCMSRGLYTTPKRDEECITQLGSNLYSLLGVAQFRASPTQPEVIKY